jgi:hypothetical protein
MTNNHESREMCWFTKEEIEALDEQTEIFGNVKKIAIRYLIEG